MRLHKEKLANLEVFKNTSETLAKFSAIKQLDESLKLIIKDKEELHGFQV
jgi:hypothetical protein